MSGKFLLVDDSKFSCKRQAEIFTKINPKFEITKVFLPTEALKIVLEDQQIFDLIFLDFNMPEMDGLELAEKLQDRIPVDRIILLTATSAFATKSKTLPEGMRLIQKPLSAEKIIEVLTEEELGRGKAS